MSPLGLLIVAAAVLATAALAADASGARKPTAAKLLTRDAVVNSGRSFELEIRCPGSARTCAGKLVVRELRALNAPVTTKSSSAPAKKAPKKKLVLARGEATLAGGISTSVGLELTKKGFKRVRRRGPILARVVMRGRDATGRSVRLNRKIRIAVPVRQKPSLVVGVADDRIQGAPQESSAQIRGLNAGAVRIMFLWEPGQAALSASQVAMLAGIVGATPDLRVILSSRARSEASAPLTDADRSAYCSFLGDAAAPVSHRSPTLASGSSPTSNSSGRPSTTHRVDPPPQSPTRRYSHDATTFFTGSGRCQRDRAINLVEGERSTGRPVEHLALSSNVHPAHGRRLSG